LISPFGMIRKSMPSGFDPMGGRRFSEGDHAPAIVQRAIAIQGKAIAL
jgi:hypothetical protein